MPDQGCPELPAIKLLGSRDVCVRERKRACVFCHELWPRMYSVSVGEKGKDQDFSQVSLSPLLSPYEPLSSKGWRLLNSPLQIWSFLSVARPMPRRKEGYAFECSGTHLSEIFLQPVVADKSWHFREDGDLCPNQYPSHQVLWPKGYAFLPPAKCLRWIISASPQGSDCLPALQENR